MAWYLIKLREFTFTNFDYTSGVSQLVALAWLKQSTLSLPSHSIICTELISLSSLFNFVHTLITLQESLNTRRVCVGSAGSGYFWNSHNNTSTPSHFVSELPSPTNICQPQTLGTRGTKKLLYYCHFTATARLVMRGMCVRCWYAVKFHFDLLTVHNRSCHSA
jgi:hypothetical protein